MTKTELYAAWQRYMHRADLVADMDTTFMLASERIEGSLLLETVDLDAILADNPRIYLHAGLNQLAELAQDDVQAHREDRLFGLAVQDYMLRQSINAGARVMARPYRPEDTADAT